MKELLFKTNKKTALKSGTIKNIVTCYFSIALWIKHLTEDMLIDRFQSGPLSVAIGIQKNASMIVCQKIMWEKTRKQNSDLT